MVLGTRGTLAQRTYGTWTGEGGCSGVRAPPHRLPKVSRGADAVLSDVRSEPREDAEGWSEAGTRKQRGSGDAWSPPSMATRLGCKDGP
ncbi:hypothetical protein Tco_0890369 [Tanacetum coccineum]|uniref:Uncharacterized protein n=1 Tax=Tanacetum coccineum TaxID=301880 RepID=A0ABQ5C2X1_9ASTR